jgi:hypothetical protein
MRNELLLSVGLVLCAGVAEAQQAQVTPDGSVVTSVVTWCGSTSGTATACSSGGSGGGGAVTAAAGSYADGAIVTLGLKADTAWSGSGAGSAISIEKAIYGALIAALPAGTNNIGTVNTLPTGNTPVACTASTIVTGGTAVTFITGPINGGYVKNPLTTTGQGVTAENGFISLNGAATTTEGGLITAIEPGVTFSLPALASGKTVSVDAATTNHKFSCVVW